MDDIAMAIESIVFMVYALITYFNLIKTLEYENIFSNPVFWFNTAVLVYFAGSLFVFVFSNRLLAYSQKASYHLWAIHSVCNIMYNLLIATGFWKTKKKQNYIS